MATQEIRKRVQPSTAGQNEGKLKSSTIGKQPHPAGEEKHGILFEILRGFLAFAWFAAGTFNIMFTQFIGCPLYFLSRDYYYAYMALTKQTFGVIITTITQWFSPTLIRVSWDPSLRGQFRKTADGRLETSFPERMVLISNHQIYTDWLYLWWTAYTSRMHGHFYIILKESLKYIPILGTGMMFYGFIFMARQWASDKSRIEYRLRKLQTRHKGPMSGSSGFDPMWLLIFPEGTNLSANTKKRSVSWSEKSGIPDMKHQLLPRSTGLYFCLQELKGTVHWVYDCTIGYEGIPKGGYGQDYFSVRSIYLQGRPPKSVNLYWRRFEIAKIPMKTQQEFEKWIDDRWREKDELLEQFYETGRFPADLSAQHGTDSGYINTAVKLRTWLEIPRMYVVLATTALLVNIVLKVLHWVD